MCVCVCVCVCVCLRACVRFWYRGILFPGTQMNTVNIVVFIFCTG